jgi:hypothetical protein
VKPRCVRSSGNVSLLRPTANLLAVFLCLLFFATGILWIERPGLQNDEVLFGAGVYPPFVRANSVRAFKHEFPLMVMTYVGTVKALVYRTLIFPFVDPTAVSVRVPTLALGALSVWLFYRLLLRVLGARAALIGTALLATDTLYLLTIRWDWGPVALQHLCLIAGVLAMVRFHQERQRRWLALGFFIFGLGMWDKALFIWTLAALGISTLVVFPRFARELLKPKYAGIAVLAFCVGALPLIIYNVRHQWITFRSNTSWSTEEVAQKRNLVWATLNGSALFGSIVRDEWEGPLRQPQTTPEQALFRVNEAAGTPRENLHGYLLIASLLMLPFVREVWRPAVFVLVFGTVLWLQMAFTKGAGTGAHHTILLWPVPQFVIAATLSGMPFRLGRAGTPVVALTVTAACFAGLLVTSTYYTNMIRNGGSIATTEASWPASDAIKAMQASGVCVLDWGFYEIIRLLHKGQTPICVVQGMTSEDDREYVRSKLRDPAIFFITHTQENRFDKESLPRFLDFASQEGYKPTNPRIFYDFNGRPMIETFQVEPK